MTVFNRINWRASGEVGFGPTNGSSAGELAEHLPPNPDSRRPPRPGGRRRARGLAAGTVRGGLGYLRFVYSPPKRGEESSQRTRTAFARPALCCQHCRAAKDDNQPQAHPLHWLDLTVRQLKPDELPQPGGDSDTAGCKRAARDRVDDQKQDRRQEVAKGPSANYRIDF